MTKRNRKFKPGDHFVRLFRSAATQTYEQQTWVDRLTLPLEGLGLLGTPRGKPSTGLVELFRSVARRGE